MQFKPQLYDVIILDIEMCGITGLEVAEEIRKIDKSLILAFFYKPSGVCDIRI